MKYTHKYVEVTRTVKFCLIGLAVGAIILFAYLIPLAIHHEVEAAAAAIRQENLASARGEAYDSFALANVALTVLLDGRPHEGMSVAADRGFWTVPQSGEVHLPLAPGSYQFVAGYANRKALLSGEIFKDQANAFVLDVNKAPSAPELQVWEIPPGESIAIPLGIAGADKVTSPNLPESVVIVKRNGEFVLLANASGLSQGFYCLKLTAENEYGQAFSFVCLRLLRDEKVTPIYTPAGLDHIRNNLSGHYILMNDIDMSGVDDWIPIGAESYPFTGIFDGGGHEITGFHAPEEISSGNSFALFAHVKNGELRNVIFREPSITPKVPARDIGFAFSCGVLSTAVVDSLVENCAALGGVVSPSDGWAGGLFAGIAHTVILNSFNSSAVICNMANSYLPNTGGITGGMYAAYIANCANEGEIKGNHLSGGLSGHGENSHITRCVNSGYIWGSTIVGAVPAGGIIQSNDNGSIANCYFVRGQSAIGAHSNGGYVAAVIAIEESDLRKPEKLPQLVAFDGDLPQWAYASLDAKGPVPYGIFREQTPAPILRQRGDRIHIPPVGGVRYFYTLDGSDPCANSPESVDQINITLHKGQTLTVFAAKQGLRDSEIIKFARG